MQQIEHAIRLPRADSAPHVHVRAAQAHLSRAGSIMSGRLEAAMRYTLLRFSVPSISVRSEFTTLKRGAPSGTVLTD